MAFSHSSFFPLSELWSFAYSYTASLRHFQDACRITGMATVGWILEERRTMKTSEMYHQEGGTYNYKVANTNK